jgi:hypothetical protein
MLIFSQILQTVFSHASDAMSFEKKSHTYYGIFEWATNPLDICTYKELQRAKYAVGESSNQSKE